MQIAFCSVTLRVRPCLRFLNTSSIHTYYINGLSIRLTLVFGFNCCCVRAPDVSCDTAAQRCLAHVACEYSGVYVRTTNVCALHTEADASTNSMHNQRTAQRKPLWYMPMVTTVPAYAVCAGATAVLPLLHTAQLCSCVYTAQSQHTALQQQPLVVELEEDDVTIRHNILLALLALFACFFDALFITKFFQVFIGHDFCTDEPLLKVSVDHTCCLWCQPALLLCHTVAQGLENDL
eukprot:5169-Heterococcus_DN1.PRE.9